MKDPELVVACAQAVLSQLADLNEDLVTIGTLIADGERNELIARSMDPDYSKAGDAVVELGAAMSRLQKRALEELS